MEKTFRVVAEVTTYCYIDIVAEDENDAKNQAKNFEGVDFYTMEEEERPGSFTIIEAKQINHE